MRCIFYIMKHYIKLSGMCLLLLFILISVHEVNAAALTNSVLQTSNAVIDVGQITVINTIITPNAGGGENGYTSNWFWIAPNVMTGGASNGNTVPTTIGIATVNNIVLIVNAITSNQIVLQTTVNVITNTLLTTTTSNALGVWTFNTLVIDSNGDVPPVNVSVSFTV